VRRRRGRRRGRNVRMEGGEEVQGGVSAILEYY
jgi:hypothetical protein